jgi:hypothetical protein
MIPWTPIADIAERDQAAGKDERRREPFDRKRLGHGRFERRDSTHARIPPGRLHRGADLVEDGRPY